MTEARLSLGRTASVVAPFRSRATSTGICSADRPALAAFPPRLRAGRGRSDRLPLNDSRMKVSSASTIPVRLVGFTHQPSLAYASVKAFPVAGRTVALLGLNSAWMCARYEVGGGFDDRSRLVIGEPQVHDALMEIERSHVIGCWFVVETAVWQGGGHGLRGF